ncbi:MAG TPA: ABC transporter permease [Vicinamibacteria bacterium]|nr:ABC transporter permease [Vicinamibacteria bacterium]
MIEVREALRSGAESLRFHALRSFLAMLGIIFGVGAVIAMLSIGAGAEREALALIDAMGLRNVIVRAKDPERENDRQEMRRKSPGLDPRDVLAIREAVPGVESVLSEVEVETWKVLSATGRAKPEVRGVSHDLPSLQPMALREGRFFDRKDEETYAPVCVIGSEVRRDLFGFEAALGRPLKVNDQWLTVIGVLAASGGKREIQGVAVTGHGDKIYVPVTTARRRFGRDLLKSPLDTVVVRMEPGTPVQESAAVVKSLLDRLHSGADDFSVVVPEALLEQSRRTQRLFDVVMGAIASISLLVGGIGIMNIMLATVLERTREIGVRRAVGARQVDIRNQFVIESFAITAVGGVVGILVGLGIAKGVAAYAGWKTIVTVSSILVSVGVSAGVGLVFGIYPALRAARLDPIEALRYE